MPKISEMGMVVTMTAFLTTQQVSALTLNEDPAKVFDIKVGISTKEAETLIGDMGFVHLEQADTTISTSDGKFFSQVRGYSNEDSTEQVFIESGDYEGGQVVYRITRFTDVGMSPDMEALGQALEDKIGPDVACNVEGLGDLYAFNKDGYYANVTDCADVISAPMERMPDSFVQKMNSGEGWDYSMLVSGFTSPEGTFNIILSTQDNRLFAAIQNEFSEDEKGSRSPVSQTDVAAATSSGDAGATEETSPNLAPSSDAAVSNLSSSSAVSGQNETASNLPIEADESTVQHEVADLSSVGPIFDEEDTTSKLSLTLFGVTLGSTLTEALDAIEGTEFEFLRLNDHNDGFSKASSPQYNDMSFDLVATPSGQAAIQRLYADYGEEGLKGLSVMATNVLREVDGVKDYLQIFSLTENWNRVSERDTNKAIVLALRATRNLENVTLTSKQSSEQEAYFKATGGGCFMPLPGSKRNSVWFAFVNDERIPFRFPRPVEGTSCPEYDGFIDYEYMTISERYFNRNGTFERGVMFLKSAPLLERSFRNILDAR
mgnify:CR=1 FL=1